MGPDHQSLEDQEMIQGFCLPAKISKIFFHIGGYLGEQNDKSVLSESPKKKIALNALIT